MAAQVDALWKGRLAAWESVNNMIEELMTKASHTSLFHTNKLDRKKARKRYKYQH